MKLSAASAHELMKVAGTAASAAQYREHAYFGVDLGQPRFSRLLVLDAAKLKGYFGKPKAYLKKLLDNARLKGVVEEDEGEEEEDAADGRGAAGRRAKKQRTTAGGGGGGRRERQSGVAIVGGATIQRSTLVSSLTPKLITGFGVKKVAAYTAAHAATATTQSPLPESLGGLLDAGEQRLVAAKVAGIGAQTWAALLAALRAHFGGGGGGSGGSGGDGGDDGGADGGVATEPCPDSGGQAVITRLTATATLAHALVPSVTSHGFAAKVAKVGAVQAWATCGGLVDSADLDALKPERVSLSWLRELQAAVSSALSGAAPMAVDEPGEDSVGEDEEADSAASTDDDLESAASTDDDDDDEDDSDGSDAEYVDDVSPCSGRKRRLQPLHVPLMRGAAHPESVCLGAERIG